MGLLHPQERRRDLRGLDPEEFEGREEEGVVEVRHQVKHDEPSLERSEAVVTSDSDCDQSNKISLPWFYRMTV